MGNDMAQVRTSGKQAAARKAARERAVERAAEFRRRQEQLEELAAEYFVAADAVDAINEEAEARIQKIRDEAAAAVVEAEQRAQTIIGRMLDTKVTRDEVAERLGISVRDVRRAKTKAAPAAESGSDDVTYETRAGEGDSPIEAGVESYAA
jgi:DNA-directed RNA polymerase specialized sigma subunit